MATTSEELCHYLHIINLGRALRSNQKVQDLAIYSNNVSKHTLVIFFNDIQHSAITTIEYDENEIHTIRRLLSDVNRKRLESKRKPILVEPTDDEENSQIPHPYYTLDSLPPETVTGREGVPLLGT